MSSLPQCIDNLSNISSLQNIIANYFEELMLIHSIVYMYNIDIIDKTVEDGPLILDLKFNNKYDCDKLYPIIKDNILLRYNTYIRICSSIVSDQELLVTVVKIKV